MRTMPLNLIEKACEYTRQVREEFKQKAEGIIEPLTPKARYAHEYLFTRECINIGCRKAVKLLPKGWKRSVAYSILMMALLDIFHYGKKDEVVNVYNKLLQDIIGDY